MKPRCRRLRWLLLAAIALPPLIWALFLLILPTDWARGRIATRLSEASGRSVRLESLSVGFLGNVGLKNLSIGAPKSGSDPWLTVSEARLNINLLQILTGHIDPTEIQVDGISLRVRRRIDGTLELSDLLERGPDESAAASSDAECPGPTGLDVLISNARVEVIDEPSQTRLEFTRIEGLANCAGRRATIRHLKGIVSGGSFELAAQLDRTTALPSFEGQLRAHDVTLGERMTALGYLLGPVTPGSRGAVDGRLAVDIYLRGQGATRDAIQASLIGNGSAQVDRVQLTNSKLLSELASLVELDPDEQEASVKTQFTVSKQRVQTDDLTLTLGRIPLVFSGWTGFDGSLSYRLRSDSLTGKLSDKARDFLADLKLNLDELASIKVQGTIDDVTVMVDDVPLGDRPNRPDDRQRYRELGRKLKDRLLR